MAVYLRQKISAGRAQYELVDPPAVEPSVCRYCGADILQIKDRWYALEGHWPNLAHCRYSARTGAGVGHAPTELRTTRDDRPATGGKERPA